MIKLLPTLLLLRREIMLDKIIKLLDARLLEQRARAGTANQIQPLAVPRVSPLCSPGGDFEPSILPSAVSSFASVFLSRSLSRPRFVARARDARLLVNERVVNCPTVKENA